MASVRVIGEIAQLRAISSPLRVEILKRTWSKPLSAGELADGLGENLTKLYYHLSELEKHGFLEVARTRQKGNLVEKLYRPTAELFRIDPSLFRRGPEGAEALLASVLNVLDSASADFERLLRGGHLGPDQIDRVVHCHRRFRLTGKQARELERRLRALIEEYDSHSLRNRTGERVGFSLVLYPDDDDSRETEKR